MFLKKRRKKICKFLLEKESVKLYNRPLEYVSDDQNFISISLGDNQDEEKRQPGANSVYSGPPARNILRLSGRNLR